MLRNILQSGKEAIVWAVGAATAGTVFLLLLTAGEFPVKRTDDGWEMRE